MGIPISSIGLKVSWAASTTSTTRPSSGYKILHNLKEFPDTNATPNTVAAASFDNEAVIPHVALLQDLGGALALRGNLNNELIEEWNELCEAHDTATAGGKAIWLCVDIPKIDKAFYYPIEPTPFAFSGAVANGLLEQNLYFTIIGDPETGDKPDYATTTAEA